MAEGGVPVIGVDVGGTKIAAAEVIDGHIRESVEIATHTDSSGQLMEDIQSAVEAVLKKAESPAAIGIGIPSQVDSASGTVLSSVNIPLAGVRLGEELHNRFGLPVIVDNDANCAALAEARAPGSEQAHFLVMYTLGTGVGGGVVIDGRIYRGATGLGAELGHVVIEADGPECPGACPNRGCLEALCSGTALERDANALARDRPQSRLGRIASERGKLHGKDVEAAARDGDADAIALFERFGRWLGVGIANAINAFEPEQVVIGGGLSRASDLFLEVATREAAARALPAIVPRVKVRLARTGAEAGVVGAAIVAAQELTPAGGAGG